MGNILRLAPKTANQGAHIHFAAKMRHAQRGPETSHALMYMAPPLLDKGFSLSVSNVIPLSPGRYRMPLIDIDSAVRELKTEITNQKAEFLAFPVYDESASNILHMSEIMHQLMPTLCLVFGATFITANPRAASKIFGSFPNVIMINGEAEYALPLALNAYLAGQATSAPGVFIKKGGITLGSNFETRVSLTKEEHEALSPMYIFQEDVGRKFGGIDLMTSRGCQERCSFCVASGAFRRTYLAWGVDKTISELARAYDFLRSRNAKGNPRIIIGINDDGFFYSPRGIEFLHSFQAHPLSTEIDITLQTSFAPLFNPDGSLISEIPELMMRPNGTPFVRMLYVGGDFWTEAERRRNKGHREARISNLQIRNAISAFRTRKIPVQSYWLINDEDSTLEDFIRACAFLNSVQKENYPYFITDSPEPVFPYSSTKLRQRILGDPAKRQRLEIGDQISCDGETFELYQPIDPGSELFKTLIGAAYGLVITLRQNADITPGMFLDTFRAFYLKWRNEILGDDGRKLVALYKRAREVGLTFEQIAEINPEILKLENRFRFFHSLYQVNLEEMLGLSEIEDLFVKPQEVL